MAISYPWEPSEFENPSTGGYTIGSEIGHCGNRVRNVVLYRAIRYARAHDAELIWVDQECIDQDDSQDKETGIQSMDIVYSRSAFPLALLSVQIQTTEELNLLEELFHGDPFRFDSHQSPHFRQGVSISKINKLHGLIARITSDRWWGRAWTFQEDYKASGRMCLLLPHGVSVSKRHCFGRISGELEIHSATFRIAVSHFILAYENTHHRCHETVFKAKQYNIMNRSSSSDCSNMLFNGMSPIILSDILHRDVKDCDDILPILANCCDYTIRLDPNNLVKSRLTSLSTCILVLYFLNGELISNGHIRNFLSLDICAFLENASIGNIDVPTHEKQLTFIKNCRLAEVKLSETGIETFGWVWQLKEEIDTSDDFNGSVWYKPCYENSGHKLHPAICGRLRQMAAYLRRNSHIQLSRDLSFYINPGRIQSPSDEYQGLMANVINHEIKRGAILKLDKLIGQN